MNVVWVDAGVFRFEFLAAHRGTMMHGAQRNAFDVSAVFKVCAVSATFQLRGFHLPLLRCKRGLDGLHDVAVFGFQRLKAGNLDGFREERSVHRHSVVLSEFAAQV
jgi:hypothetical protein